MDAVVLHGTPLVEDPGRVKKVRALGIDETSFLSATREHRTIYDPGVSTSRANPNRIIEHAGAPGLGAIWPWLVAIGAAVVVLMVIAEWRRAERRARRS